MTTFSRSRRWQDKISIPSRAKKNRPPLLVAVRFILLFSSIAFSHNACCDDRTVFFPSSIETKGKGMVDVATKIIEIPETNPIIVRALDFHPTGTLLAVRSDSEKINIWDWKNQHIVSTLKLEKSANDNLATTPLRFSPNGRFLVACHGRAERNVVARIWNSDTWKIVRDVIDKTPSAGCDAIDFSSDGKYMIRIESRSPHVEGNTIVVSSTETWKDEWGIRTVPFYPYTLAVSYDSKFIALGGEVINPVRDKFSTAVPSFGDPPFPDMKLIVIIDIEKRIIVRTIKIASSVNRLTWNPDGKHIASTGRQGVQIFDTETGSLFHNIPVPSGSTSTIVHYTPNGKYLIEGISNDNKKGCARIWDSSYQAPLQTISENVGSIAVSSDSQYFAIGANNKTLIWKLQ